MFTVAQIQEAHSRVKSGPFIENTPAAIPVNHLYKKNIVGTKHQLKFSLLIFMCINSIALRAQTGDIKDMPVIKEEIKFVQPITGRGLRLCHQLHLSAHSWARSLRIGLYQPQHTGVFVKEATAKTLRLIISLAHIALPEMRQCVTLRFPWESMLLLLLLQ